ncbi:MAG: guanylate kinase [Mariprofundaceae bacterium]|nr:guanylate kinase [Mariprofundaceae bacterium]
MAQIYIISGPSGCGKTSLCKAWLEADSHLKISISCTTRQPRPSEIDGIDYHFLDEKTFQQQKKDGAFLEHALVHGNWYGTRISDVQAMLDQDVHVLLEIDWQGAAQVATKMDNITRIFMIPPSIDVLRERLESRAQDDAKTIDYRVAAAQAEMVHSHEADIQLINDDFNTTLQELLTLSSS